MFELTAADAALIGLFGAVFLHGLVEYRRITASAKRDSFPGLSHLLGEWRTEGPVDDVFEELRAEGVDLHLERLDDGTWWIGVTHPDGRVDHVTLSTRRAAVIEGRLDENVG